MVCRDHAKFRHVSTASISISLPISSRRPAPSRPTLLRDNQVKHIILPDVLRTNDSCILPLPTGDELSYAQVGRSKEVGQVWVLFHGTPGCRLSFQWIVNYAENNGIRVIVVDRPGYGHSSMHKRGMSGFVEDVKYLLDYLGIQEFRVYGVSGGGPYALAAAYYFAKSRLLKTLIMCGSTYPEFDQTAVQIRWRMHKWLRTWVPFWYQEMNFNVLLEKELREAKDDSKKERYARLDSEEMQRQGSRGYNNDFRLLVRPWGFDLQNIDANPIMWYHGSLDLNTSADAAKATVGMINRHRRIVQFREIPGLDHFTLQENFLRESLAWLQK